MPEGRVTLEQQSGVFYDLLPPGGIYRPDSAVVYADGARLADGQYRVEVLENYRDSGRALLVVRVNHAAKEYRVSFTSLHPWDAVKAYGDTLLNSAAYETGNADIGEGRPDDGGSLDERALMADLDPATDAKKFIYAQRRHDIGAQPFAASLGLYKKVRAAQDSRYANASVTYQNRDYVYMIHFASDDVTQGSDLMLFDSIENYIIGAGHEHAEDSDWHGIFRGLDVRQARDLDIDAKVYYSTEEDLDFYDLNITGDYDFAAHSDVWQPAAAVSDLSTVRAFAVDLRKTTGGGDYILPPDTSLSFYAYMRAPADVPERADGKDPVACNNIFLYNTLINTETHQSNTELVRQDYTQLRYRAMGDLEIKKVDSADPAKPVAGIVFRLSGTSDYGNQVDVVLTTDRYGRASFRDIERGSYDLQEIDGVPDYLPDHEIMRVTIDRRGVAAIEGLTANADGSFTVENDPRAHGDLAFVKRGRFDGSAATRALEGEAFGLRVEPVDGAPMNAAPATAGGAKPALTADQRRITVTADEVPASMATLYFDQEDLMIGSGYAPSREFWYRLTEIEPEGAVNHVKAGVSYDTTAFYACVTVLDDERGGLETSVTYYGDRSKSGGAIGIPRFENRYAAEIQVPMTVEKRMTGDDWSHFTQTESGVERSIFEFTLRNAAGTALQTGVRPVLDRTSPDYGRAVFTPLRYTQADLVNGEARFLYTIEETHGGETLNGVRYDPAVHSIEVHLQDKGDGTISAAKWKVITDASGHTTRAAAEAAPVFTNAYAAQTSVVLEVSKHLTGRPIGAGEFSFTVTDRTPGSATEGRILRDTTVVPSGVDQHSASGQFDAIHYDQDIFRDALGRYADGGEKVFVYEIADGSLEITALSLDGEALARPSAPVSVTNRYGGSGAATLFVRKRLNNADWTGRSFGFELTAANDAPLPAQGGGRLTLTAESDAVAGDDGARLGSFGEIAYTRPGVYIYDIAERIPGGAVNPAGILYSQATHAQRAQGGFALDNVRSDSAVQRVTVTVTDPNEDGRLQVDVSCGSDIPTFVNEGTLRDVRVTKDWDDADDQDGLRPEHATVQLRADGEPAGEAVTLNADEGWAHTWTDQPRFGIGGEITYTVEETNVPAGYVPTVAGDMATGFTVTNAHTPAKTQVSVTKVWDDADDQDGLRPESATVQLKANGEPAGDAVTLSAAEGWTYTWTNLDANANGAAIAYTVEETNVPAGYAPTVAGDMATGYTITNTHAPELTEATVKKVWDDDDAAGKRPASLRVTLSNGESVTLNADNGWTETVRDLPAFSNGARVDYTWTEGSMPAGYALVSTTRRDTVTTLTNRYSAGDTTTTDTPGGGDDTDDGTTTPGGTVPGGTSVSEEDTPPAYTTVTGRKTWKDNDDAAGLRPTEITVILLRNNVEVDRRVVTAADNWRYTFSDLPVRDGSGNALRYAVYEEHVSGYYARINGYDIVNALITEEKETRISAANYTEEELEGLIDVFDYQVPLWGRLLKTGDDMPAYPFVFGGIGMLAVALLLFGRKRRHPKSRP